LFHSRALHIESTSQHRDHLLPKAMGLVEDKTADESNNSNLE
jgi:hypothetical protein